MAESSESYVWIGSQTNTECQPNMECSGCHQLRKEVDSLRSMLMNASVHQRDDDVRCHSTYISDQKQKEIDKMLLDARSKSEMFQEAYEKTLQEKHELVATNNELKKQLDEKVTEVAVLKEQNTVYATDFQLERKDRERSQSRLIELEEQLTAASQRIADLEDDKQQLMTNVTTTRRQNHHIPVHREFVAEPGVMATAAYPEHHLPSYSSVGQPHITHHSTRSFRRGYDVCDSPADNSHIADVR